MYVCMYVSTYLSIYPSICLYIYLSIYRSINLLVHSFLAHLDEEDSDVVHNLIIIRRSAFITNALPTIIVNKFKRRGGNNVAGVTEETKRKEGRAW